MLHRLWDNTVVLTDLALCGKIGVSFVFLTSQKGGKV